MKELKLTPEQAVALLNLLFGAPTLQMNLFGTPTPNEPPGGVGLRGLPA